MMMGPNGWALMRDNEKRIERAKLRDQFAMAALTGLLANGNTKGDIKGLQAHLPGMAYDFADAMLAAREAG